MLSSIKYGDVEFQRSDDCNHIPGPFVAVTYDAEFIFGHQDSVYSEDKEQLVDFARNNSEDDGYCVVFDLRDGVWSKKVVWSIDDDPDLLSRRDWEMRKRANHLVDDTEWLDYLDDSQLRALGEKIRKAQSSVGAKNGFFKDDTQKKLSEELEGDE